MGLQASTQMTTGRILVVEDDQGARDLIVSSLRADGHEVDASGNGFEALRLLGRQCYDLIVSDLMMPEVDGPSLYSAVRSRWPSNPPHFVFVSAARQQRRLRRLPEGHPRPPAPQALQDHRPPPRHPPPPPVTDLPLSPPGRGQGEGPADEGSR